MRFVTGIPNKKNGGKSYEEERIGDGNDPECRYDGRLRQ
jgi:hypothetical protein